MLEKLLGELYTDEIKEKVGDVKLIIDDGKLIDGEKFNQLTAELAGKDEIIASRDKQLESLKKSAGDSESLKAEIAKLQEENVNAKAEFDNKLVTAKTEYALENRLIKEGAVNVKAVKALLDSSKISFDGDKLAGLDEQLEAIRASDAWAFKTAETKVPGTGGNPASGGDKAEAVGGAVCL